MSFIKFYPYTVYKCNPGRRFIHVMIMFKGWPYQVVEDLIERMKTLGYKCRGQYYGADYKVAGENWMIFSTPGCIMPSFKALYERRRLVKSIQDVKEAGVL